MTHHHRRRHSSAIAHAFTTRNRRSHSQHVDWLQRSRFRGFLHSPAIHPAFDRTLGLHESSIFQQWTPAHDYGSAHFAASDAGVAACVNHDSEHEVFMRTFSMEMGVSVPRDPETTYCDQRNAIPLGTIGSGSNRRRYTAAWDDEQGQRSAESMFRPDAVRHTVLVDHLRPSSPYIGVENELDLSETSSQDLIVHKDM